MTKKKSYCKIIIILVILVIIIISIVNYNYKNKTKISSNQYNGKYWTLISETYDKNKNIYTLNFSYKGNLEDINRIKKISFAVGNADKTQIINVFDTSMQDQFVTDDIGLSQKNVFLDFKKYNSKNFQIKFDEFNSKNELLNNKTLIEINWSYSDEDDLENKDTIRIE